MVKVKNIFAMEIYIEVYMSMVYLKVMDNIFGQMVVILKGISNKELEMDLEFGKNLKNKIQSHLEVIIYLIGNQDMESMFGNLVSIIKVISFKI
jgi:hypothetical protein